MKTTTRTIEIQAYTDESGRAVCGKCELKPFYEECRYQFPKTFGVPDPTCPIWQGDSKSSISALIEEISNNKEVIVSANQTPQNDADEPRYAVHITGPERLLIKLADLFFIPPQEK